MQKWLIAPAVLILLAGCEQEEQTLPFDVEAASETTVSSSGGTVSTAAGASLQFRSGSLGGSTQVSVTPTEVPAVTSTVGAPASPSFRIEPAGTRLAEPAQLDLRFNRTTDSSRSWLASVATVVDGKVYVNPAANVDLSRGVVSSEIDRLGTVTTVLPPPSQVVRIGSASTSLSAYSAESGSLVLPRSISAGCGYLVTFVTPTCNGVVVNVSQNLLDQVSDAALLYPSVYGEITLTGGSASGQIEALGILRTLFQSGQNATSIGIRTKIRPTANTTVSESGNQIILTNMYQEVSGFALSTDDRADASTIGTIVFEKTGSTTASYSVSRSFDIRTDGGVLEPAFVRLFLSLTLNP